MSLRTGERYNEKVDIYSFALVLLELVACEMPWFSVKTSAPARVSFPLFRPAPPCSRERVSVGTVSRSHRRRCHTV